MYPYYWMCSKLFMGIRDGLVENNDIAMSCGLRICACVCLFRFSCSCSFREKLY